MSFAGDPREHDDRAREARSLCLFELQAAEKAVAERRCGRLLHHVTEGHLRLGQLGAESDGTIARAEHREAFRHFRGRFKALRDTYEARCALPEIP